MQTQAKLMEAKRAKFIAMPIVHRMQMKRRTDGNNRYLGISMVIVRRYPQRRGRMLIQLVLQVVASLLLANVVSVVITRYQPYV